MISKAKIAIIEDDEDILELVRYNLAKEGYRSLQATSGEKGLELVKTELPDLVLLDLMLPGIDGLDVCRALRSLDLTKHIPIIILTAKSEESDVVSGLELGADDFLVKPFSPRVLLARIKTVLRRNIQNYNSLNSAIKRDDLVIDPKRHQVSLKGKVLELTFTEFKVLELLAKKPGWVYSRYQIVDAVRGDNYHVTARAVDVQVAGLRKKLGTFSTMIETVRGVGYRFTEA